MEDYKILWIDDDVNHPDLLSDRDALEDRGCIITPISNPDDIEYDNIPFYDCIIIDLSMPIGTKLTRSETIYGSRTGFVILQKIKEQYPQTKLVVYSVFDVADVRAYCNEYGIQYWSKSVLLSDEFADNIVNLLKGIEV